MNDDSDDYDDDDNDNDDDDVVNGVDVDAVNDDDVIAPTSIQVLHHYVCVCVMATYLSNVRRLFNTSIAGTMAIFFHES